MQISVWRYGHGASQTAETAEWVSSIGNRGMAFWRAHIMTQKSVMDTLLYHQELECMGGHLSRQTMSNWILRAAQNWLKLVYKCLYREQVKR